MSSQNNKSILNLYEAKPAEGFGILYAFRTARTWWYSAWLRTFARFSRTYLGSFWLGLSNIISVVILGMVYAVVLKIDDPWEYLIYLGLGYTLWNFISPTVISSCSLFSRKSKVLGSNVLPLIYYCLEEWAFQIHTFAQSLSIILIACAFIKPIIIFNTLTSVWLPLINIGLFCFWIIVVMAILGSRFRDMSQLIPIMMRLTFLISPILYPKEGLGKLEFIANINPFFRILSPVRTAIIDGKVYIVNELFTLLINLLLIILVSNWLKKLRYKMPFWV